MVILILAKTNLTTVINEREVTYTCIFQRGQPIELAIFGDIEA